MIYDRSERLTGARVLLVGATGVAVVWGLHFAEPVLLPAALALFLAVLTYPMVTFLRARRVPDGAAIGMAVLLVVGIASLLMLGATRALTDLRSVAGRYLIRLDEIQAAWVQSLENSLGDFGAEFFGEGWLTEFLPLNLVGPERFIDFLGGTAQLGASLLAQAFLVVLIMAFILAEMCVLPGKLEAIFGAGIRGEERQQKVIREVQEYLGIKTVVSLMTGLAIGGWAWFMGLDFPVLLGLIGFFLNYIPTVGSIIASVPGIALSLIIVGTLGHAIVVAFGYFVINTVFGSILEPNLMGRRLGLSTLVVVLSLVFWGWTWGPVGALLSVPLTMVVKIFLENTRDLRWVAVLLDKRAPTTPMGEVVPIPDGPGSALPGIEPEPQGARSGPGEVPVPDVSTIPEADRV